MQYSKPPLTFEQQAEQLIARGLVADREKLIERLKRVNYYRLSGYLYPFRRPDQTYKPGTSLDEICRYYTFDRQLRLLVLDAIERVEIAVRTDLVYQFAHQYGPFGHCDKNNLPFLSKQKHSDFLERIDKEKESSREIFVEHFIQKYGDNQKYLPLWMAAEIMSFGTLFTFFTGVEKRRKQAIAVNYGVAHEVLHSWLGAINAVRNICAHHGRLWNREIGFKPKIPHKNKHPQWHEPVEVQNNRVFGMLTILKYMLNIVAPQSKWPERVKGLLERYSDIPRGPMGFPDNWQECPIWISGGLKVSSGVNCFYPKLRNVVWRVGVWARRKMGIIKKK